MSEARIMIVEDERVVAEDIKEGLQNMGYAVTSVAKSGEMALKEWQNIFNAISDCVLILDLDGYILNSNGVYESMTGQKTENIIGQHCYNVMHCSSEFIKNDPIEKIKQNRIRETF